MHTPDPEAHGPDQHKVATEVAACLSRCLDHLDRFDSGLAAVHLSMALETLKHDYRLGSSA